MKISVIQTRLFQRSTGGSDRRPPRDSGRSTGPIKLVQPRVFYEVCRPGARGQVIGPEAAAAHGHRECSGGQGRSSPEFRNTIVSKKPAAGSLEASSSRLWCGGWDLSPGRHERYMLPSSVPQLSRCTAAYLDTIKQERARERSAPRTIAGSDHSSRCEGQAFAEFAPATARD